MQDAEERVRMAKERLEREARARAVHAAEVEHARQDAEARRQAEIIALELAHRERMTRVGGGRSRWAWIATGIIVVLGAVTMVSWVHADRGQGEQPSLTKTEPAKERRALRTVELEGGGCRQGWPALGPGFPHSLCIRRKERLRLCTDHQGRD